MLVSIILRGFIIGMVASMPPGPVGVLCIQRTLSKNQKSGFVSGLAAASADAIYAMLAFFSLSFVVSFIESNIIFVKVLSGLVVMGLGVKVLFSNPVIQIRRNRAGKSNLWQDFITVFLVTIANPVYILFFIPLFAAFGISQSSVGLFHGSFAILGVFLGAATWWFTLSVLINLFRKKFRPRHMLWINRISGSVIIILGLIVILTVFINIPVDGILR